MNKKHILRFLSKISMKERNDCWLWTGTIRSKERRYGVFTIGRKMYLAHRVSYEYFKGAIPKDKVIMHSCDNTLCVSPYHLEAGTQSQNIIDCVARGRHIAPIGEKNGMAKLTTEKVKEIRARYSGKWGEMTAIAKEYNVSVPCVHSVINKKRWRN